MSYVIHIWVILYSLWLRVGKISGNSDEKTASDSFFSRVVFTSTSQWMYEFKSTIKDIQKKSADSASHLPLDKKQRSLINYKFSAFRFPACVKSFNCWVKWK